MELRGDRINLRQQLLTQVSCQNTLNPANNPSIVSTVPLQCSGAVKLYRKDNNPLTDVDGKLGSWSLTVKCTNSGFNVIATKKTAGNYARDPAINLPMDESHPKAKVFLDNETPLCAAELGAGPSPPASAVSVKETHVFTLCYPYSGFTDPTQLNYLDVCTPASTIQSHFVKAANLGHGSQGTGAGSAMNSYNYIEPTILTTQKYRSCAVAANLFSYPYPQIHPSTQPAWESADASGLKRWIVSVFANTTMVVSLTCVR